MDLPEVMKIKNLIYIVMLLMHDILKGYINCSNTVITVQSQAFVEVGSLSNQTTWPLDGET